MGDVQPPAGQFGEADVALDLDDLGFARDAGKPQARCHLAGVHHPVGGQAGLLGVLDDDEPEAGGVGENPGHDQGVGHRLDSVRERKRARFGEQRHLGEIPALEPAGGGPVRIDLGEPEEARAAGDELHHRHVVDDRVRVRKTNERGDPPGGRGAPGGGQRPLVLVSRLAQLDADVDEPG